MRRISIINQKGGVGKTTTTANLGAACSRAGLRTLLIDLDPQAHLTLHFGVDIADEQRTIYDVLTSGVPLSEIVVPISDSAKLVPSDTDLAGAEAELVAIPGREVILREAIASLAEPFDVLLIDCPPALGVLTLNALTATNEVMVPLQAQFFALQGLGQLLNTVSLVRQRINPQLRVSGMIFCMHESTTRLAGEVEANLGDFLENARGADVPWCNARIYETRIRRNIKLAEASSFGKSVFDYAPKSKGAIDYDALARELFGLKDQSPAVKPVTTTNSPGANARRRQPKPASNDNTPKHLAESVVVSTTPMPPAAKPIPPAAKRCTADKIPAPTDSATHEEPIAAGKPTITPPSIPSTTPIAPTTSR